MLSRLPWHPGCWHLQRKQCQGLEVCSGRNGGDGKSLSCAWHGHLRTSRGPQNSKFFVPRLWFSEKFQAILSMVKPPSLADLMIESCQFDPGFFFRFLDPGNSHRASSSSKCNFWPWKKNHFGFLLTKKLSKNIESWRQPIVATLKLGVGAATTGNLSTWPARRGNSALPACYE